MTLLDSLCYAGRWLYYFAAYIGIVMLRCTFVSLIVAAGILILRKTLLKHATVIRCTLWSVLLLVPFMGRLRWYYETRAGLRMFYWLTYICMQKYYILDWIYVLGVCICAYRMIRGHRRLRQMLGSMENRDRYMVTELHISPFSMGLLHPRIVVPQILCNSLSETELEVILEHEETHIRLFHLWMLRAWEILSCILWMNPLMWIGLKYFKRDLEQVCDSTCMQEGRLDAIAYGDVLIKCAGMLSGSQCRLHGYVAFAGESDYQVLKSRIVDIRDSRKLHMKWVRAGFGGICGLLLIMLAVVYDVSYPRYTKMEDISVYDSTGIRCVLQDSTELRNAVSVSQDSVHVDREAFDQLISQAGCECETYFIYFGGYYKMPGIGGGGNGVFYNYAESVGDVDIFYKSNEDIWNYIMMYL